LERIAAEAKIGRHDWVLEIGCGFGSLTRYLSLRANHVVAVELDERLAAIARDVLAPCTNVMLVCGDILALDPRDLGLPPHYIVAANIPYYVTSPILRHLLESQPKPRRMVLTVQKEVGERMCAAPPNMSLLALSVQVYGNAEVIMGIPAEAFVPAPNVDSAVVRIETHGKPVIPQELLPRFFFLARAGFGHRRKTLRNSLAAGLRISPPAAETLLIQAHIDPRRRAETLSLPEWALLAMQEAPGFS
jgi:16S rRNA (adenine1518-N6/adenine1519-N6)-dimethyltransferase